MHMTRYYFTPLSVGLRGSEGVVGRGARRRGSSRSREVRGVTLETGESGSDRSPLVSSSTHLSGYNPYRGRVRSYPSVCYLFLCSYLFICSLHD